MKSKSVGLTHHHTTEEPGRAEAACAQTQISADEGEGKFNLKSPEPSPALSLLHPEGTEFVYPSTQKMPSM
jgi:hypothetical protein